MKLSLRFARGLTLPLRHFFCAFAVTLFLLLAVNWWMPPPFDLAVDAEKDLPLFSQPFGAGHTPFSPGMLSTPDGKLANWRAIPGAQSCGQCHLKETLEWATSMHAISDLDLIYDGTVRENTDSAKAAQSHGMEKGRWCESCHNPLGVLTGAVTQANSVQELAALEEGTSCVVCHAVNKSEPMAGNGALEVDINGVFRYAHPALIAAAPKRHARDMRARRGKPLMGQSELCGACHTEIRPAWVNGETPPMNFQDTYDEWRHSPYAQAGIQCQDCHMASDPAGFVAALKRGERPKKTVSHRMPGNNYLLSATALPGSLLMALRGGSPPGINRLYDRAAFMKELSQTHEAVAALLREAAELRVERAVGAPDGETLTLDIGITNAGAGHALPTGPLDQRHIWLEIEGKDASGKTVFHRGRFDDKTGVTHSPAALWMKEVLDMEGKPDLRHLLFDAARLRYTRKPIPPKATDTVRVEIPLAKGVKARDLTVEVRLWYRLAVQDILKNIESQNLGKIDAIIPPLLLRETRYRPSSAKETS
ncbi:MAG: hypothetical protein LBG69_05280 [Zoogloeaceae bacterium]|jgi:mono/diheme cytochrome c family protein|nr:hypothetical protein [Zoogloeaceae bacterium]